jgi:hypothetical protein
VSCEWSVLYTAPINESDSKTRELGYVVSACPRFHVTFSLSKKGMRFVAVISGVGIT